MRPDWRKSVKGTIIVHADNLEVKSAPSTPSKKEGQAPKLKRSSIKIYRVHHRSPLIVKGLILGFCSIVTLGLATIGYLFYRISKRK